MIPDPGYLDDVAARAFPAAEEVELDGWVMRASGEAYWGRTRSVWTRRCHDSISFDSRMDSVVEFYRDRAFPPLMMVSDHSEPAGLATLLRTRGWSHYAGAAMMALDLDGVTPKDERAQHAAIVELISTPWLDATASLSGWRVEVLDANRDLLERTPGVQHGIASIEDSVVTGLGRAVLTDRELGIFGMLTAPGHRGRGVGAEILNSLLTWGRRAGATVAYLQVERDNLPAVRLYSGAGFVPVYDYDYWTLDARGGDSSRGEVSDGLPLVVPEWQ